MACYLEVDKSLLFYFYLLYNYLVLMSVASLSFFLFKE